MSENTIFNMQEGLSRSERFPKTLHPSYVKIDDRQIDDLLEYTVKLASLINYYNFNNTADGSWESFFSSDVDILLTLLSKSKLKTTIRRFEKISLLISEATDRQELTHALNDAFELLYEITVLLQKFRVNLGMARNRNSNTLSLYQISDSCSAEIGRFVAEYSQALSVHAGLRVLDLGCFQISTIKMLTYPVDSPVWTNKGSLRSQIKHTGQWFSDFFTFSRQKLSGLLTAANYYAQHHTFDKQLHEPHLGLFVTFLHLYKHVQKEINTLSAKHLDFYYKEVIGILPKPAVPDKVHLVFQLAPAAQPLLLRAGEQVQMEIAELKQKRVYTLHQDVVVSQARIKELKTQYVSQTKQIYRHNADQFVKEFRIYTKDQPVLKPADINEKNQLHPWALLGEEQSELPHEKRTMDDAQTGLVIASPVLYAKDGKRQIQIKFYPTAASYFLLSNYIQHFSQATGYSESVITHNILDNAFVIHITGEKGWEAIPAYNLRLVTDAADKALELNFMLHPEDKPVVPYYAPVHGADYGIAVPAVRMILNNAIAYHHPFSFFKDMVLEKISLKTSITNSRLFALKSNFGPLLNNTPFQIFGPQPSIGSYLDISNPQVFHRYLKNLSIYLRWFDLPREIGGFETYFEGYESGIRNDSFQVSISSLQPDGAVTHNKRQQQFQLFETTRDDTSQVFLEEETRFRNIDCTKLGFTNGFRTDPVNSVFKEDGIRIELVAPRDGFGNRLYPAILPGIIAHNTKKFSKKFIVPNPPYIPVVKSLSADYTLEHTEMLTSGRNREDAMVTLIHLHPSGYEQVYPNNPRLDLYLVPQLLDGSCLYIGLERVEPGQALSLLFQLEQKVFHHTAHDVVGFQWSYLQDNSWVLFEQTNVLSDTTNNFLASGIVTLKMPAYLQYNNTVFNSSLCWIKAAAVQNSTAGSKAVAVVAQAGLAVQHAEQVASDIALENLPPGSVKGFLRKIPEVTKIYQPFPSANGRKTESEKAYRLRVSERLRHKNRALTALDISQMILEEFPHISAVKCLNQSTAANLVLPGINFQLVVIPRLNPGMHDPEDEPHVSLETLLRIKQFIARRLSHFARAEVGNPVYEKVKVKCSVNFKKDAVNINDSYYTNLLNLDIRKFIAPWLFDKNNTVITGGKIFLSDLLDYLKKLPYINFITGFSLMHFYRRRNPYTGEYSAVVDNCTIEKTNLLEASRQDAILFPYTSHAFGITEGYMYADPMVAGVGSLEIGSELTLYGGPAPGSPVSQDEDRLYDMEHKEDFVFDF